MTPPHPKSSERLRRASAAEIRQLRRERERRIAKLAKLREEVEELEQVIAALDERIALLARLAGPLAPVPEQGSPARAHGAGATALRGPAIRKTAVRLLATRVGDGAAIHYRDWLELLHEAGYFVAGRDERAVFLSQISRSPVVARTTQAGTYRLDPEAPDRLRRRLTDLHAELRRTTAAHAGAPADVARLAARRRTLNVEIGRTERALEEASEMLVAHVAPALSHAAGSAR